MSYWLDGVVPWNSLDDNTRAPLASELETGYPCGEADQELFNFTAGYPMGQIWNVLLNSGITPDKARLLQLARAIQSQKMNYAVAGGTANAVTVALTPAPAALTDLVGVPLRILISAANTGAVTLKVGALAAKNLVRPDVVALSANDLVAGDVVEVVYDGTQFRLMRIAYSQLRTLVRTVTPSYLSFRSTSLSLANSVVTNVTLTSAASSFAGGSTISGADLIIGAGDAGLWQFNMSNYVSDGTSSGSVGSFVKLNGTTIAIASAIRDTASVMEKAANCGAVALLAAGDVVNFAAVQSNMGATKTMGLVACSAARVGNS